MRASLNAEPVLSLTEAAAAHSRMEAGEHIGKIMLEVGGG
jgi:NADPH:quinone reductase-like Zn-dependent oxidoreductase